MKKGAIVIRPIEGRMPLLTPSLREYLTVDFEASYSLAVNAKNDGADMQASVLYFDGVDCAEYIVRFSTDEKFSFYAQRRVKGEDREKGVRLGTLLPDTTYYAQVFSAADESVCSDVVKFQTENVVVRPLTVIDSEGYGPRNVRDVGGYSVAGGGRIRYGKVYRGTVLRNTWDDCYRMTDGVRAIMRDELGIKAEIDLRKTGIDDYNVNDPLKTPQTENELDASLPYIKLHYCGYDLMFTDENSPKILQDFFNALADERNYPVYIHCAAGADRTGSIVFLLQAMLGVSREDAILQYEMTSFSPQGKRTRDYVMQDDNFNYVCFGKMLEMLMGYAEEGASVQEAVTAYLLSVGVTKETLDKVRRILVEE